MRGNLVLYVDQYGQNVYARTVDELREKASGRVSKMYRDGKNGKAVHVGYVVGQRWFMAYVPFQGE